MSKRQSIIRLLLHNPVFANILMLVFLGGGVFGAMSMVRESFPDFELDIIQVMVPYPGADPEEVEEGISRPLEDALEGIGDVKRSYTIAAEGMGMAIIEVEEGGDLSDVKDEVKTNVDAILTFPEEAERPVVRDVKFNRESINLVIWGEVPERQLKELAQEIKDDLVAMPDISMVQLSGIREYQVSIEISEEKLRQYNLQFSQVSRVVARSTLNLPGGSLQTDAEDLKIRILGRRYHATEFEDLVVLSHPDGTVRRLRDIAEIRDTFDPDDQSAAWFNGKPAVRLQILNTDEEDAIRIAKAVRKYAESKRRTLPPTVELSTFFDVSRLIQDRIDLLARNGTIGLFLVFCCLWLFLDLRMSFWVTMGIPISLAGALLLMYWTGQSLNMISLFGLIMVLGIIVDDAIVVGEAIYAQRENGEGQFDSAVNGVREVFWSVVAAVTTTIVAFVPLFFISGIMGKFIGVLPGPVVAALTVSLFEALLILPVHLRHLPKPHTGNLTKYAILRVPLRIRRFSGTVLTTIADRFYGPLMDRVLRWRYVTIAVAVAILLITLGMVRGDVIPYRFMPEADGDFLQVMIEMPNGTPVEKTQAAARHVLAAWEETAKEYEPQLQNRDVGFLEGISKKLRNEIQERPPTGDDLATGIVTLIGSQINELGGTTSADHLSQVFVELMPAEERGIHFRDIEQTWRRNIGTIPGATSLKVQRIGAGPPGSSIELDLLGRDGKALEQALNELVDHLETFTGVYDIQSTHRPGKRELRVRLKDEARPLGIALQDVAAQLRQGFYGDEVARVQRGADEVKIMVRYPGRERRTERQLDRLRIKTADGREVPLGLVAEIDKAPGLASVRREEGRRLIRVTAEVSQEVSSGKILKDLLGEFRAGLERRHQVALRLGPRSQDQEDSIRSIQIGFMFALAMIFLIMATIFRSYLQPAIIMLTIPFGLLGAVFGHMIYDQLIGPMPLSIMTFFGMIALTGVVVNDSIVLIVAVNDRMKAGMPVMAALREGGKRRFRAIILTSLTTVAGLFPMILEKSFQAQILIPMALALAFGVAFASTATLILMPCLMGALNDCRRLWRLACRGTWPTREDVEGGDREDD